MRCPGRVSRLRITDLYMTAEGFRPIGANLPIFSRSSGAIGVSIGPNDIVDNLAMFVTVNGRAQVTVCQILPRIRDNATANQLIPYRALLKARSGRCAGI